MAKTNQSSRQKTKRSASTRKQTKTRQSTFWRSGLGKFVLMVLVAIAILLFDILISGNHLPSFLLILGVELIIAFICILLFLAWQQRNLDQ